MPNEKILVIDDSQTIITILTDILEKEKYKVISAMSGEEGLKKAGTETPDAIILDIIMPGMDGFEVCERLKKDPKTKMIPIIMLTVKGQIMDIIRSLKAGADNYVTKPFEASYLLKRLEELLSIPSGKEVVPEKLEASKKQILGLLSIFGKEINCEVMGILLLGSKKRHAFFEISFQSFAQDAIDDFSGKLINSLAIFKPKEMVGYKLERIVLGRELEKGKKKGPFLSFINVPLMIEQGKVIGIFGVASSEPNAFYEKDVRTLFSLSIQSTDALKDLTQVLQKRERERERERERVNSVYRLKTLFDISGFDTDVLEKHPASCIEKTKRKDVSFREDTLVLVNERGGRC